MLSFALKHFHFITLSDDRRKHTQQHLENLRIKKLSIHSVYFEINFILAHYNPTFTYPIFCFSKFRTLLKHSPFHHGW